MKLARGLYFLDQKNIRFFFKKTSECSLTNLLRIFRHSPQFSNQDISVTIGYCLFIFLLLQNYDFTPQDKHVSGTFRQV